jgi:hypothetical protein
VKSAYQHERAWQSQWLIDNLGLTLEGERAPAGTF